ncbi:MAG: ice-binding family protein [Bacteroidales bacterium]|nr:ice-binding family protein [Bacteroidales bacterium]
MDPATITTSTFTLMDGTTSLAGNVNYSGTTATFNPTNNLELDKVYTATITTGATNEDGTALASNYIWTFSTGASVAPMVILTDPEDLAIDVHADKTISATFNVAMDPSTINSSTFILMDGNNPVVGNVNYSGNDATFNPDADLLPGKTYTATITTGAENEAGTALAEDYVWSFTTQYALTVIAENGTVDIDPNQSGYNSGAIVILTASPNSGFEFYSWSGDASGNDNPLSVIMDENKVITAAFTEDAPQGPGEIDLGLAGDFAILTKTGIDRIGTVLVTGHIGVTPIDHTAITGFSEIMDPSGEFSTSEYVVGNIYAADYAPPTPAYLTTAMSDQENAHTTAMGLTTDVIVDLGAGDISGMTLAPGLYKFNTGLLISNVGVTLSGGPNDTWVFQIEDDFSIQDAAKITLANGAQAKNIFWVTKKQALLGSTVEFHGNIIASTLISLNSGTTVQGRLLCQTAATLISSEVTKPIN